MKGVHIVFKVFNDDGSYTEKNFDVESKKSIEKLLIRSVYYPKLVQIEVVEDMDEYIEDTVAASSLTTLKEWLDVQKVELTTSEKHKLANLVSKAYKELYNKKPRTVARQNDKGQYLSKAYGFTTSEVNEVLMPALRKLKGIPVVTRKSKG